MLFPTDGAQQRGLHAGEAVNVGTRQHDGLHGCVKAHGTIKRGGFIIEGAVVRVLVVRVPVVRVPVVRVPVVRDWRAGPRGWLEHGGGRVEDIRGALASLS
jgi:hypothetical protein